MLGVAEHFESSGTRLETDAETSEGADFDSAAKRNHGVTRGFIQERTWSYA